MKRAQGFTLVELILVILLISIIGAIASPVFIRQDDFQERFFIDELANMIRYARKVATATGCDVQIRYVNETELALFQRKNCTVNDFSKSVPSPYLLASSANMTITIPRNLSIKGDFPFYLGSDGKVYNQFYHQPKEIVLQLNRRQIAIDSFSGLVYEKKSL